MFSAPFTSALNAASHSSQTYKPRGTRCESSVFPHVQHVLLVSHSDICVYRFNNLDVVAESSVGTRWTCSPRWSCFLAFLILSVSALSYYLYRHHDDVVVPYPQGNAIDKEGDRTCTSSWTERSGEPPTLLVSSRRPAFVMHRFSWPTSHRPSRRAAQRCRRTRVAPS